MSGYNMGRSGEPPVTMVASTSVPPSVDDTNPMAIALEHLIVMMGRVEAGLGEVVRAVKPQASSLRPDAAPPDGFTYTDLYAPLQNPADEHNRRAAAVRPPAQPPPEPDPPYGIMDYSSSNFGLPTPAATNSIGHQPNTVADTFAPTQNPYTDLPIHQLDYMLPHTGSYATDTFVPPMSSNQQPSTFQQAVRQNPNAYWQQPSQFHQLQTDQPQPLGLPRYGQPPPHQPSCWDQPDCQPARQPHNGWDPVAQPRYSTSGYPPWQPEYQPSRLPYSGTNLHIQQRIPEAGYHPWQSEYWPPRLLPLSNHSLHPPLSLTPPRSPSSWCPPSHCRSAATLPAAALPPSSLPADNAPTRVLGGDVSDSIVPNNVSHNVGATLDIPNDKVLEEIVKNDEESPQVLVEAMAEKNMVYDDKNLPQVSNLVPLLKRGVGLLPIRKEVMEILFQEGFIKFRWISSGEYIQTSGQASRLGIDEGRHLTIRCMFDPGGNSSPKLLFAALFVVSWFPP